MSIKIYLRFKELMDFDLVKENIFLRGLRLFSVIQFQTSTGWSEPLPAIIDTGAPVSVIPRKIWETSIFDELTSYSISGLVPNPECSLPVTIGEVTYRLLDEKNSTPAISFKAYLAHTDKVPVILGFADMLENFYLSVDFQNDRASLLFR